MEEFNNINSDHDVSDEEHNYLESDCGTDDDNESVDIISTNQEESHFNGDEDRREESSSEESANANKFSIDNILGLNRKCKSRFNNQIKELKCIKPTPVPAARTGEICFPILYAIAR